MPFRFWILVLFLPYVLLARASFEEPWGKDIALLEKPQQKQAAPSLSLGTRIADAIILFHQKVLSPVDGPRSDFRPTSSRYMQLAMYRYGFFKGYLMGCDRLLRENDEQWVYRTIEIEGKTYKYDPARTNKYYGLR